MPPEIHPNPSIALGTPPGNTVTRLDDRIFVYHRQRMVKLLLRDIVYVAAERAYCRIVTTKTEYVLSIPLGRLEEQLPGGTFFRVHRSYLVNLSYIDEVADTHLLIAGQVVGIGKHYRAKLRTLLPLIR